MDLKQTPNIVAPATSQNSRQMTSNLNSALKSDHRRKSKSSVLQNMSSECGTVTRINEHADEVDENNTENNSQTVLDQSAHSLNLRFKKVGC